MKGVAIGDIFIERPIIQGGMGVGISLASLAGNVAAQGGVGIISTAQIGFREADFDKNPIGANLRVISEELKKAREIAEKVASHVKNAIIGFNIMVATNKYDEYVKEAVRAGADVIISGAGLPIDLPELVDAGMALRDDTLGMKKSIRTKMIPIVSSVKSASVILRLWDRKYQTTADALVIEGPLAGGHLGFSGDDLASLGADTDDVAHTYKWEDYAKEIKKIIEYVDDFAKKKGVKIPVFVAGGIYDASDVKDAMALGASGVQVGTRFVTTRECDAPEVYKQAYIDAKAEDIIITKSPVGMPGRAIRNTFMDRVKKGRIPIEKCRNCLSLSHCDRKTIPYCITEALVHAARGEVEKALLFCGAKAYRCKKIETVKEVMDDLCGTLIIP